MTIKIKRLNEAAKLPTYMHGPESDAGMDLRSIEDVTIAPGQTYAVATGLAIELPPGFEAQVRPRSGLAFKHSITVCNAPGTIDPSYRGEIKVILHNLGQHAFVIQPGDRIAQMIVARYEAIEWQESDLGASNRGEAGFGSSGVK
ncbi:MAG: dUTP diphosphatase [Acidobacteriota bacterium]|jgi:dUTP pyrophosphatase